MKVLSGRKTKSRKNGGKRPQVLKLADEERRVDRFLNLAHKLLDLGKEIFYGERSSPEHVMLSYTVNIY